MKALVITHDRLSCTRRCVAALHAADLDVVIVDHGSTYPPFLEWLRRWELAGLAVYRRSNIGPHQLWDGGFLGEVVGGDRFVVTDPDVVPALSCPLDWPAHLGRLLDAYPDRVKAGLGLRIDNLPDCYGQASRVRQWESQWWLCSVAPGVFDAFIDTTLAMYRGVEPFAYGPALRTGDPYVAEHLDWYEDTSSPSAEAVYYRTHALAGVSHWNL